MEVFFFIHPLTVIELLKIGDIRELVYTRANVKLHSFHPKIWGITTELRHHSNQKMHRLNNILCHPTAQFSPNFLVGVVSVV